EDEKGDYEPLLKKIANIKIGDLCEKEKHLLIFPDSFADSLTSDDTVLERKQIGDVDTLFTGNILGFIGLGNVSLRIYSRFDEDDKDYFLHYMLQKVLSISLFDLKTDTGGDSIFDFLLYMFPPLLNKAVSQGLYREYQYFDRNDDNVRGVIDVGRHIQLNTPFRGKIAYRVREHTTDNKVTQLIRHTIEFIREKSEFRSVLSSPLAKDAVSIIDLATPDYNRFSRQRIIAANLRGFAHPYYSAYQPLIKLCLQILRHEKLSYGKNDNDIYGILFDGAWLWEEYMATILRELRFTHPENRKKLGGKKLYKDNINVIYPDFYNDNIVIDAKYKILDPEKNNSRDPLREDRFQIISYMHVMEKACGILLYPSQKPKETKYNREGVLNGYRGEVGTLAFKVPKIPESDSDFWQFCEVIGKQEGKLKDELKKIIMEKI
ncbi:MAG: hypothetical protein Q4G59_12640, partial [Planctomycetia bacterium]|nr:hypothetical protein [Planctomycetia bacterium]